jgi:hypothetical protein
MLVQEYGVWDKVLFGSDYPFTTVSASIEGLRKLNAMLDGTSLPRDSEPKAERYVCTEVADTGAGMDETLDEIFRIARQTSRWRSHSTSTEKSAASRSIRALPSSGCCATI